MNQFFHRLGNIKIYSLFVPTLFESVRSSLMKHLNQFVHHLVFVFITIYEIYETKSQNENIIVSFTLPIRSIIKYNKHPNPKFLYKILNQFLYIQFDRVC